MVENKISIDLNKPLSNQSINYEKLTFVLNGTNRIRIFIYLMNNVSTASDIAKYLNISLTSVCRTLKELEEYEIIENVSPFNYKGKLYKISKINNLNEFAQVVSNKAMERKFDNFDFS